MGAVCNRDPFNGVGIPPGVNDWWQTEEHQHPQAGRDDPAQHAAG